MVVGFRADPSILDLFVKWYSFGLGPTATAEDTFEARASVHADIAATRPSTTLLKLISDFCTVTHRKVVEHVTCVNVGALLYLTFLLLVKD